MAIDESRDHGQATAVDADRAFRDAHVVVWTDCDNIHAAHEERHVVSYRTCPIDEANLMNGNCHDLPSHAIGMSRCLETCTGSGYPPTSNPDFFKRI